MALDAAALLGPFGLLIGCVVAVRAFATEQVVAGSSHRRALEQSERLLRQNERLVSQNDKLLQQNEALLRLMESGPRPRSVLPPADGGAG